MFKQTDVRDYTHEFISPYSQPLMKISLIDERLSGDTGGTKPVLEVPVSQVIEKPKSPDSSVKLLGKKRGPTVPVELLVTSCLQNQDEKKNDN